MILHRTPSLLSSLVVSLLLTAAAPAAAQEHRPPTDRPGRAAPPSPAPPAAGAPSARPSPPPDPAPAPSAIRRPPVRAATGYLGVVLADVSGEDLERLGLSEPRGAIVREVVDGSPAEEAGLREEDVVLAWRGESVYSAAELQRLVRETPSGRQVRIRVLRDGERTTLTVTPGEEPGMARMLRRPLSPEARARMHERMRDAREHWRQARERLEGLDDRLGELDEHIEDEWSRDGDADSVRIREFRPRAPWGPDRPRLGVRLQELTPQLADYFGLGDREGVLVASVREGSPADSAGVRAGDVLLSVGGQRVSGPERAARAVRDASGEVELRVLRDGEERVMKVRLPEPGASETR